MDKVLSLQEIVGVVRPIAEKYGVEEIYLFGSYARGETLKDSDLDFLVFGGSLFKPTRIFSLAEDLRKAFGKDVDVFEIHEVNVGSEFYQIIMEERLKVA